MRLHIMLDLEHRYTVIWHKRGPFLVKKAAF